MPNPPQASLGETGCNLVEERPGHWRCLAHQNDGWEVALAMGATLPCEFNLSTPMLKALASSPDLDSHTAQLLATNGYEVLCRLVNNPACPEDLRISVYRRAATVNDEQPTTSPGRSAIQHLAASDPNTPSDVLESLVRQPGGAGIEALDHPNLPEEVLREMVRDRAFRYATVGASPRCPFDLLYALATSTKVEARAAVARNPKCPPEILDRMAKSSTGILLMNVANNLNTRPDTLRRMSHNATASVWLAANPHCPRDLLESLSQLPDWAVRRNVALHPKCPIGIRLRLCTDSYSLVRAAARRPKRERRLLAH